MKMPGKAFLEKRLKRNRWTSIVPRNFDEKASRFRGINHSESGIKFGWEERLGSEGKSMAEDNLTYPTDLEFIVLSHD